MSEDERDYFDCDYPAPRVSAWLPWVFLMIAIVSMGVIVARAVFKIY